MVKDQKAKTVNAAPCSVKNILIIEKILRELFFLRLLCDVEIWRPDRETDSVFGF